MGAIIEFPSFQEEEPDIRTMGKEELLEYLAALKAQIEELEDLVDEILERLDELD